MKVREISNFEFDNITSHRFDLIIASIDGNKVKNIPAAINVEVLIDKASNRPLPFYYGSTSTKKLEFPMEIYNKHGKSYEQYEIQAIQEWLFGRRKPHTLTIFDYDRGNESYECWLTNPHYGKISNGAIGWKFDVICTSPYSMTNLIVQQFECLNEENTIEYYNFSNMEDYLYPEINIQMLDKTTYIRIQNENDNNRVFQITEIPMNDNIYVNNDLGYITSTSKENLFKTFNLQYFRFAEGFNKLKVSGKCILTFRNRFYKAVGGY